MPRMEPTSGERVNIRDVLREWAIPPCGLLDLQSNWFGISEPLTEAQAAHWAREFSQSGRYNSEFLIILRFCVGCQDYTYLKYKTCGEGIVSFVQTVLGCESEDFYRPGAQIFSRVPNSSAHAVFGVFGSRHWPTLFSECRICYKQRTEYKPFSEITDADVAYYIANRNNDALMKRVCEKCKSRLPPLNAKFERNLPKLISSARLIRKGRMW